MTTSGCLPQHVGSNAPAQDVSAADMSCERSTVIRSEQIKLLYTNAPFGFVTIVVNALVLVFAQWNVVSHATLLAWLCYSLVVTLVRSVLVRRFCQLSPSPPEIHRWGTLFVVGAALSGAGWGAAGIWLFPDDSIAHQVFVTFVLGGMTAGAVTTLSSMMAAFLSFMIPALLPVTVHFFTQGDALAIAMGGMVALYMLVTVFIAWKLHNTILTSLQLRFENSGLIASLTAGKAHVERLNAALAAEITERARAEGALRKAYDELEQRVQERTTELAKTMEAFRSEIVVRKQAEEVLTRQTQELARSNTELEQFAYVVTHDLKEPLSLVSSYVQLLVKRYKDKLDADAQDFIGYAVDAIMRMQALIHDMLAFSLVGSHPKSFERMDCNVALNRALANLKMAIEESGAVVTADALPVVFADSLQLVQLFQNLIGNAIKFRRKEAPTIHVACRQERGEWLFAVADNGIGIEAQYADRIFTIFQRLHSQDEYPGTGIGLAICKRIVEFHGGRIWAESKPGVGSTFRFTIPVAEETLA